MASKKRPPKIKPSPYPFKITYLPLPKGSEKLLKSIDSWYLLEYLRQEALRRSEMVHALYEKNDLYSFDRLRYGTMWWNLYGIETPITFELIEAMFRLYFQRVCFQDMKIYLKEIGSEDILSRFGRDVLNWDKNYLLLQIDASYPPNHIIEELRPYLHAHHENFKKDPIVYKDPNSKNHFQDFSFKIPWHPVIRPPFKDFKTWLNYLKCYDLRRCKGLSYGQIAIQVYGPCDAKKGDNHKRAVDDQKRDLAEKAYKRVTRLIECAENHIWPPTGIK